MPHNDNENVRIAAGLNARGRSRNQASEGSVGATIGDNSGTGVNTRRRRRARVVGTPGGARLGGAGSTDPGVQASRVLERIERSRERNDISDRAAFQTSADIIRGLSVDRATDVREASGLAAGARDRSRIGIQQQEQGRRRLADVLSQENLINERALSTQGSEEASRVDAEGRRLAEREFALEVLKAGFDPELATEGERESFRQRAGSLVPSDIPTPGERAGEVFTARDIPESREGLLELLQPGSSASSITRLGSGSSSVPAATAASAPTIEEPSRAESTNPRLASLEAEFARASGRDRIELGRAIAREEEAVADNQGTEAGENARVISLIEARIASETSPERRRFLNLRLKRLKEASS